ncbi:hypothetical protein [Herbaspirillum sp. K2R10-39]|uniref:hypothetical protein n=1 Tax=Noviherbaspirillum cavernae TaxID=2320862 RepID=UPI0013148912
MVCNDDPDRLLFDMDMSIIALHNADGSDEHDSDPVVSRLTGRYHNLLHVRAGT